MQIEINNLMLIEFDEFQTNRHSQITLFPSGTHQHIAQVERGRKGCTLDSGRGMVEADAFVREYDAECGGENSSESGALSRGDATVEESGRRRV